MCLIDAHPSLDTFKIVSEIMESRKLVYSIQAPANTEVSFSTDELGNKMYWIYGYDEYGIIAGPRAVKLVNPSDIAEVYSPVLNIYPNPTYDIIYICSDFGTLCEVDITSLNGQFVFRGEIEGTTNQIDLSSFRSGVYFITIRSKEFVTTRKIVKLLRR